MHELLDEDSGSKILKHENIPYILIHSTNGIKPLRVAMSIQLLGGVDESAEITCKPQSKDNVWPQSDGLDCSECLPSSPNSVHSHILGNQDSGHRRA